MWSRPSSGITLSNVLRCTMNSAKRWLVVLLFASLSGCGGGTVGANLPEPVNISYQIDGSVRQLIHERGRPVVLILMRTSEVVSQIYMQNLRDIYMMSKGCLGFVVLTIEPTEAPFVAQYVAFEKLPFQIGVASPAVLLGRSALGVVPGIPTTYFIDETGAVVEVISGVIEKKVLEKKVLRYCP